MSTNIIVGPKELRKIFYILFYTYDILFLWYYFFIWQGYLGLTFLYNLVIEKINEPGTNIGFSRYLGRWHQQPS